MTTERDVQLTVVILTQSKTRLPLQRQAGIENGIRYLIAELIRMALSDRLRCKH